MHNKKDSTIWNNYTRSKIALICHFIWNNWSISNFFTNDFNTDIFFHIFSNDIYSKLYSFSAATFYQISERTIWIKI